MGDSAANDGSGALQKAVAKCGSQAAFARLIGVAQPSVWKWLNKGKALPAHHVLKVEAETGVSKHELRPDIYPDESGHDLAADRRRPADSDFGAMEPTR